MSFLQIILIFVVFAFALTAVLTIYKIGGIYWDFIAEILYAKSLLTSKFYFAFFSGNLNSVISYGNSFYFEVLRPPLIGIIMVPFMAIGTSTGVPIYLTFVLLFLLASCFYLSKRVQLSPLLMALLFFTPYVLFYFVMLNGAEIITMCFLLVFIGLVIERRWEAGIVLALAGLAKYDSLIFLLLLAVLPPKVRNKALAAFGITTLPWLIFNTVAFHNPIWSYILSIHSFSAGAQGLFSLSVISASLKLMLPYLIPAFLVFAAAIAISFVCNKKRSIDMKMDYRHKVVFASFGVGLFGWLLTAISGSINGLPREAFLIYIGIALILGVLITDLSNVKLRLPFNKDLYAYLVGALFVLTVGMLIYAQTTLQTNYVFASYGSTNPIYKNVTNTLAVDGLGNCNVISNYWPYLFYFGVKAHSPYYYNSTVERYPIVILYDNSSGFPINFMNVTKNLTYNNFTIYFPKNWTCG